MKLRKIRTGILLTHLTVLALAALALARAGASFGDPVVPALMFAALLAAVVLSLWLAHAIRRPLRTLNEGIARLAAGDFAYRIAERFDLEELNLVADSFNAKADRIMERDAALHVFNEHLSEMNKSYLDLVGFVAHELKGILATTVLNAYMVRDGHLGLINFKQRKALDAVTRNLDHLDATVRNFLNLSRIEKGELHLARRPLPLKGEAVDVSVETFRRLAEDRSMAVSVDVPDDLVVSADLDLLLIVVNNLVGNAIKYGKSGGAVRVLSRALDGDLVETRVENDGRPLADAEIARLFKKFSRLDAPETRRARGTGLGLFVTRDIVERHGGTIRAEAIENGNAFIFTLERGTPHGHSA